MMTRMTEMTVKKNFCKGKKNKNKIKLKYFFILFTKRKILFFHRHFCHFCHIYILATSFKIFYS